MCGRPYTLPSSVVFFFVASSIDGMKSSVLKEFRLDLGEIHRLVDAELLLRADDPILRRLREVEAGSAGCTQLRDHPLVVRERDLDVDAGFLLELRDDVCGHVVGPRDEAQLVVLRGRGSGHAEGDEETGDVCEASAL